MMDIDTPEGMEFAKAWTLNLFGSVKEGAVWAIPRSCSMYTLFPKEKRIIRTSLTDDSSLETVCKELGFTVEIGPFDD